ncbi:uncharacterized protein LOC108118290 [Drosophila eugracilis]|uniref:uncharacterized protein LOC108118290 n=1 Tax=Drosophila eugracilis TaxID=29029 RepID=UPI001BDA2DD2|nr:uncharacterized protein LOC108118290 [Drosophila eugracilis]
MEKIEEMPLTSKGITKPQEGSDDKETTETSSGTTASNSFSGPHNMELIDEKPSTSKGITKPQEGSDDKETTETSSGTTASNSSSGPHNMELIDEKPSTSKGIKKRKKDSHEKKNKRKKNKKTSSGNKVRKSTSRASRKKLPSKFTFADFTLVFGSDDEEPYVDPDVDLGPGSSKTAKKQSQGTEPNVEQQPKVRKEVEKPSVEDDSLALQPDPLNAGRSPNISDSPDNQQQEPQD